MRRLPFAAVMLLLSTSSALADSSSVFIEDLTWMELKQRIASGSDSVLIPTGGTEQNGPAIALGKHNWIVRHTSEAIAKQLGNTLVAPPLPIVPEGPLGVAEGNMRYPGTLTVSEATFEQLLEDEAKSLKQAGFKYIFLIGEHGGAQQPQKNVAARLAAGWEHEGIRVAHIDAYYADSDAVAWARQHNLGGGDPATHGGYMDTAVISYINPKALRPALVKDNGREGFNTVGASGDARGATAEQGKQFVDLKIKAAVEQIKSLHSRPAPDYSIGRFR